MLIKIVSTLLVLFMGSTIFLFLQNRSLTEKTYEILAINNYKSLSYLLYLKKNKSLRLKESLIADLVQLIQNYDKTIYFKNKILKNICKDITLIENSLGKDIDKSNIKLIQKDCGKK